MFRLTYLCLLISLLFCSLYAQCERKFFRDDYHYIETVESFYKVQPTLSSWQDAKQMCEAEGATLFYPKNEVEFNAVYAFVKEAEGTQYGIWVDLSTSPAERYFKTSDGLELAEVYNTWGDNEPNNLNGQENCLGLSHKGLLHDWPCANKKPFMCKKTLASLEVQSPSTTITDIQCEKKFFRNDYHYIEAVESFYKIQPSLSSWQDAKQMCEAEGATLFYPKNEVEFNAVYAFVKEAEGTQYGIWVDLSTSPAERYFKTSDGLGLAEVYNTWGDNEPNNLNGQENCLGLSHKGLLHDWPCANKKPFMCKKTLASLAVHSPSNTTDAQCERKFFRDDYHYIETVESFYKIQPSLSSWQDAKQMCEAEGATLFYPKNEVEFNAVYAFVKEAEGTQYGIWVDLSTSPAERYFKSSDGLGLAEVYNTWGDNEPNNLNGQENCLGLSHKGLLHDWPCANKKPFMCKKTLASLEVHSPSNTTDEQGAQKLFRKDYHYIESVKNFYKIHTESKSWVDAKERCEWEGTTLYYPTSEAEANAVNAYVQKAQGISRFWIGITSLLSEKVFMTTDGLSITEMYIKWKSGEPNNYSGDENCVENYGEGLNDYKCSRKQPFICKKTLASLEWNAACHLPYADYKYNETLGKCYKFHTSPKNWTEANAICSSELSYLAVIDSQDEADFFGDILTNDVSEVHHGIYFHGVAHVGLHNKFGHGWRTIKDTPLENTEFWGEGQPGGDAEACGGMLFNGQLRSVACNQRCFFICEHDVCDENHCVSRIHGRYRHYKLEILTALSFASFLATPQTPQPHIV